MKKSILLIFSMIIGAVVSAGVMVKLQKGKLDGIQKMSNKHLSLFLMMNQWIKIKQEGRNLDLYFEKNGYKNIAIYGMSYVGETLIDELKNTNVSVVYGIDRKANSIYADVDVVSIDDILKPVDAVVVTAITFYKEIEEKLSEKIDCPIISLENILYEV